MRAKEPGSCRIFARPGNRRRSASRPAYGSSSPVSAWCFHLAGERSRGSHARSVCAARLGDGSQNVSWIALEDLVRAIGFVLEDAAVRGTVNMVAPQHLTNAELTGALARHYRVSLRVGVPGWIVRAIYGEAAQVLLSGQCAVPEKLTAAGFTFDAENIERFLERSAPLGK